MNNTRPPWLALVPGLACDAAVWRPVEAALAHGCRTWVPAPEPLPDDAAAARLAQSAEHYVGNAQRYARGLKKIG